MTKLIYLARHGLTEGNIKNVLQDNSDPLSEQGRAQAKRLGQRFSKVTVDLLMASDAPRATETAAIVAQETGHALETSPLFRETSVPASLVGVRRDDPQAKNWYAQSYPEADPAFRMEDEESFADLKARAMDALGLLIARPEQNIAVVSHGNFIRFLAATMLFGERLTPAEWKRFAMFFATTNTGITVARRKDDEWLLLAWNDHAHLAE